MGGKRGKEIVGKVNADTIKKKKNSIVVYSSQFRTCLPGLSLCLDVLQETRKKKTKRVSFILIISNSILAEALYLLMLLLFSCIQ